MADLIYNANGGVYAPKSQEFVEGELVVGAYYTDGTFKSWSQLVEEGIVTETEVSSYAFEYSRTLEKIVIPSGVNSIGGYAFYGCDELNYVSLPNSLTYIGDFSFSYCSSLTTITIPNSVTYVGDCTFDRSGLISITIPSNITTTAFQMFYNCTELSSVVISSGVECINDQTFYNCTSLTSIAIPNSVTSINYPFGNCENLTTIYYSGTAYDSPWSTNATILPYSEAPTELITPKKEEKPKTTVGKIINYSPTRSGHTFLGWAEDSTATTATYQPNDTVTGIGSSITLYAIWQKNNDSQDIYLCKDGTCFASEFIETDGNFYFDKDGKIYSPSFVVEEVEGGQFAIGADFIALNFVEGTEIKKVYSEYALYDESGNVLIDELGNVLVYCCNNNSEDIIYTITYDANDGSGNAINESCCFGESYTLQSESLFSRTGYVFNDWNTEPDGTGTSYAANEICIYQWTSDITLYAQWTPAKIKLTFDANGGSGGITQAWYHYGINTFYSDEACATEITSITKPTKTGYTFVHYYGDGASGGEMDERYVGYDDVTFAADLCTDIYKDATLYAKWTINQYYLDVNHTLDGSSIDSSLSSNVGAFDVYVNGVQTANDVGDYYTQHDYGSTYEVKDIKAMTGYTYSGQSSYSGTIGTETKTVSLVWKTNVYTISYNANGGSGAPASHSYTYAASGTTNLSSTIPTRTDYEFLGWSLSSTATSPSYSVGQTWSLSNASNYTLYAVWRANPILTTGFEFEGNIPSEATSIIFTDEVAPANATLIDVSKNKNGGVMSWLDGTTYKISSQVSGKKVIANEDSSYMFDNNSDLSVIPNVNTIDVSMLDVSNVTNMKRMFAYVGAALSEFKIVGLNSWNTSNVTDMSYMFYGVGGTVAEAGTPSVDLGDLSGWNTSNVTDMNNMFCYAGRYASTLFRTGDLSGWNTSNVTDMSYMFYYAGWKASNTWSLDLSGWNVNNVTSYTKFNGGVSYIVTAPTW